jgi:hypothetical protein
MSYITEIACIRVLPPYKPDDREVRMKFLNAKKVMEKFTKRDFYFLQQIENPDIVYIIGEWESLEQHMDVFIPSEENQALLRSLEGIVKVEDLLHISVPHAELPFATKDPELLNFMGISRIRGSAEYRVQIAERYLEELTQLREWTLVEPHRHEAFESGPGPVAGGGLRIDSPTSQVECVIIWSEKPGTTVPKSIPPPSLYASTEIQHMRPLDVKPMEFVEAEFEALGLASM